MSSLSQADFNMNDSDAELMNNKDFANDLSKNNT
jgi:hypothetical protein